MRPITILILLFGLMACTGIPADISPVQQLNAERYLGTWYEIARLDHSFERGLSHVTANYSLREDGGIKVANKGYEDSSNEWNQATGKAYFMGDEKVGHLKVSFFGPFYASYVIFDLAEDYSTAYVAGYNHDYLWLLARKPEISQAQKDRFVKLAQAKGFDLGTLIWVKQDRQE